MAFAVCEFLKLLSEEVHFFLIIFHYEKASTQKLIFHYQQQIHKVLKYKAEIQSRVYSDQQIDFTKQMRFFSEWLYIAIFTVVQIPDFRNYKKIAEKLHLSEDIILKSINWMTEQGFLKQEKGQLMPTSQRIHLSNESLFIDQHHRNWRNEAIRSLNRKAESDLHYSGSISISQDDYFKVRELLLQSISNVEKILKPSKDEDLIGICIDLFKY